nr:integrase, catalytic region, zinc finger, CCHC-type, peptidase aspartic, catalytic [Tanacetum cinerariifolium]
MAAGLRDRPLMLALGRYPQWRSRFLRYVNTRPNSKALRKCILSGPYKPSTVLVHAVEATKNSPAVAEHTTLETPANMSLENKAHFLAEKEAIHLILTGIGDDIYLTVDACQTAQEIWEAIERLEQGKSLNLQDYQNEVNELRTEKLARNANPLALVANAQASQDPFYQTSRSHRSSAPSPKPSIPSRSQTSTRHKGKEIAKPITPPSETVSEEDSDPEQAQREKDMQKNLGLIAKYFKKIYKPTNNNLRTSSNSKNKSVHTTSRYKNDNHSGQFGNQRTVDVAAARDKVGSTVVQKSGIQCFNCKEYGHFAKECRKPKRVKDSAYHKEKMLLCKEVEQGVPLQAEQYDWLADTDEEVDEQELEAHYSYMAKIQEVPNADSGIDSELVEHVLNKAEYNVFVNALQHSEQSESVSNTCLVETNDSNVTPDLPDMCEDDIQNDQNDVESDDERVALANLIANLKLDTKSEKAEFSDMYDVILHDCVSKDVMCSYLQSLSDLDALAELQCMYLYKVKECDCLAQRLSKQTDSVSKKVKNDTVLKKKPQMDFEKNGKGKHVDTKFDRPSIVRQPNAQRIPKPSVLGKPTPFLNSLDRIYFQKTESVPQANVSEGLPKPVTAQTLPHTAKKAVRVNHKPTVSRPLLKSNQSRDKVLQNNSQVKVKKTQVEVHPRIPSVSNKMKSVTIIQLILLIIDSGCTKYMTGNLKLLCNFIEKFLGTVRFGLNHNLFSVGQFCDVDLEFAPILSYGDLVQGNVMINMVYYVEGLNHNLFSVGQFCDVDLEVAFKKSTCFVRNL